MGFLDTPAGFGTGLRDRAANYHRAWDQQAGENARQHGQLVSFGQLGPLRDPDWDSMFQAMDEQGVTKMGQQPGSLGALPSTIDPTLPQTGMTEGLSRSNHIGNVMGGIRQAAGRRRQ